MIRPAPIVTKFNLKGENIWVSQNLPKFYKTCETTILKEHWREFVHESDHAITAQSLQHSIDTKCPIIFCVAALKHDNTTQSVRWFVQPHNTHFTATGIPIL